MFKISRIQPKIVKEGRKRGREGGKEGRRERGREGNTINRSIDTNPKMIQMLEL